MIVQWKQGPAACHWDRSRFSGFGGMAGFAFAGGGLAKQQQTAAAASAFNTALLPWHMGGVCPGSN